ncbi:MAG: TIGR03435 family protein [Acidobacteriia bacterium]|nr:TIGR03435 family protein [Terriglobia bacterium]
MQAADSGALAFEVASLKPSGPTAGGLLLREMIANGPPLGMLPGRGNRVEIHGDSAAELLAAAYQIPMRQIVGPCWMFDARFDIDALIPAGQPRTKAPEMLRTLLQQRLALQAHREVRGMSGYILSVGKGGPKLKEAPPFTPTMDVGSPRRPPPGFQGVHLELGHADMAQLADILAQQLGAPVEDQTGLKSFYSILIEVPTREAKDQFDRPSLFREALKAYGLDLAGGKIDAPILVIDNLSKTPTAN